MLLFIGVIVIISILIVFYIISSFFWKKKKFINPSFVKKLPGIPLLGSALDFSPEHIITSLQTFPVKYGKFLEFSMLGDFGILISDPDIAREVLMKRPKRFRRSIMMEYSNKTIGISSSLFGAEGNLWHRVRKATAPSFSISNLQHKYSAITEEIFAWIKRIHQHTKTNPNKAVDMKQDSFSLTIRVITIIAFGLDIEDPMCQYFLTQFQDDMTNMLKFAGEATLYPLPRWTWKYSPFYNEELIAKAADARFTAASLKIIQFKRKLFQEGNLPMNCMLDSMIYHHEQSNDIKALTDEEIVENVKMFYLGGADTTALTLSWLMYFLSLHPEIFDGIDEEARNVLLKSFIPLPQSSVPPTFEEIYEGYRSHIMKNIDVHQIMRDLPYTSVVIKEALRLIQFASFLAFDLVPPHDEDGNINDNNHDKKKRNDAITLSNGIIIERNELIFINFDGIQRNPDVFEEPNLFKPSRWLSKDEKKLQEMENSYIPFGIGPRICPGMSLAMNELLLGLSIASLFYRVSLDCPENEIQRIFNFVSTSNKMPILFHEKLRSHR